MRTTTLRTTALRAAALPVALIALTLALTGCTGSPDHGPATPQASATTAAVGLPSGVTQAQSLPTRIPNKPAARANVQLSTCAKTDDGWKAAGTIANPGKSKTTATITVFFTTDKATVIEAAQTKVTTAPGKKQSWTAQAKFTTPPKTLCVLRGVG
jgi:hypothetical protein